MKITARRRFGQNFLMDESVIDSLIRSIAPASDDFFVEIGPGRGALSTALLAYSQNLMAIEIDRDLIVFLNQKLPNLKIIAGDVLNVDFSIFKNFRLVGNLPYNISTPLLIRLKECKAQMIDAHLMLQREVVERLTAAPNTSIYGRLSIAMQCDFHIQKCFEIPPQAFYPTPKVTSSWVRLKKIEKNSAFTVENRKIFDFVVQKAFAQRRKMLRNTLRGILNEKAAQLCNIDLSARAENLSVADFVRIANFLNKEKT